MTKRKKLIVFGVVILVCVMICATAIAMNVSKVKGDEYPDRGLPVVEIDLSGVSLDEINGGDKDDRYRGNILSIYNNGETVKYDGVELKGRGNATWAWDKRPYQIKFEQKTDVLGMGRARKWYLLANYRDETNLRTETAFYLEAMLGMEPAMEGRFVELYMDGDYQGLYYLTQAVEVSKNVVNLNSPLGVLVELDNIYGWDEKFYKTGNGDVLTIKDAADKDRADEAMEGFLTEYNELELALQAGNYARVAELIDVESWAKYYLLSEFTVDPDAYWTSFYMYKDGPEDKIHAGPGWDYDMALANRNWGNWLGEQLYSPTETMVRRNELTPDLWLARGGAEEEFVASNTISTIVYEMMEMPEFQTEVRRIYTERMAGRESELVMRMKNMAGMIREAAVADGEKWVRDIKLDAATESLIDWVKARYQFMDQIYGDGVTRPVEVLTL